MNERMNADGRRLLVEISRQVAEGAARGDVFVEVRLGEEWRTGERNLSDAGGTLSYACAMLDSIRPQLPTSLAMVRIHWTPGWSFDDIQMQPSGGGHVN
jgi:hypothetical protein